MAQYGGGHGGDHQFGGSAFGYPTNFPGQSSSSENPSTLTNNDFGQQSILDQDDSHIMSSFFDNPDIDFDFNAMEHKPDSSPGFDFATAHQLAHASGATPSHTTHNNYRTNSDGQLFHHGNFAGQFLINNHNQLSNPPDESVYNTASTLLGLSNSQTQESAPDLALSSTNWLNFGITNTSTMPTTDSHNSLNSSGRVSAGANFNTHMPTSSQSTQSQQNAQYLHARLSQIPSPQYLPGVPRMRHSFNSADTSGPQSFNQQVTQTGRPQSFYQSRPASNMVRFGSDDSFSPLGYRGNAVSGDHEKELNLTNVPLADQVAGSFQQHLHRTMTHPSTLRQSNVPSGFHGAQSPPASPANIPHGLPFASPVAGSHQHSQSWSRLPTTVADEDGDDLTEDQQARKRRKSGFVRDDAEYLPPARAQNVISKRGSKVFKADEEADADTFATPNRSGKNSAKRKSTISHGATTPATPPERSESPAAGPSSLSKKARNEAKARQNLTEDQKRNNHIQSEQKRRNVIKQGYADLNDLVPSLSGGKSGLSKAEILKEVISFLENTVAGNETMQEALERSQHDDNDFNDGSGVQNFSLGYQ